MNYIIKFGNSQKKKGSIIMKCKKENCSLSVKGYNECHYRSCEKCNCYSDYTFNDGRVSHSEVLIDSGFAQKYGIKEGNGVSFY